METRLIALLCFATIGCAKEPPPLPTAPDPIQEQTAEDTGPWPRLKAIIIADLTAPDTRPVDLEAAGDKALRAALTSDGRFHSALSDDNGACAVEIKTFYGLLINGELQLAGDEGQAKWVMEAEAHCPTRGRSAGEVETYRATVEDEGRFSNVDGKPETDGPAVLRGLLAPMSQKVAATLYGQVMVRHADDDAVIDALSDTQPIGVLMEAAGEAGERKLAQALPRLVVLTEHTDEVVALRAGAALGLIGLDGEGVISALARMTEGPNQERHLIAVHTMGDIGGPRAARYLDALAVGHPRPGLRKAAREAAKRANAVETKADTADPAGHDAPPGKGADGP